MSDLISRQGAIDAWDKLSKRGRTEFDQVLMTLPSAEPKTKCVAQIRINRDDIEDLVNEKVNEIVEAMSEPKTGAWIPVSEKPKDEKRTYLVQLDSGGMCSCRWTNANPFWTELTTDWHWNIFDIPQYCKVVAWMDLKPYRDDREEYELATEQMEHDAMYEPTYNSEDGSM